MLRIVLVMMIVAGLSMPSIAAAQKPTRQQRQEHADRNDDGTVDRTEKKMEREFEQQRGVSWQHSRAKVNKPAEAKYDADGSGWLEPAEVKQMLQDKQALIKTKGRATVDSPIEAQYDDNKDGMIDPAESKDLQADLAQ